MRERRGSGKKEIAEGKKRGLEEKGKRGGSDKLTGNKKWDKVH